MKRIRKFQNFYQQSKYSKAYRLPKWLLKKFRYRKINSNDYYTIKMRLGHQIALRPTQRYLENILYSGQYHDDNIFMLESLIKPHSVILDIGANIGLYSCAYSQYFKDKKVQVYAIEAVKNNYHNLQRNIDLNQQYNIHHFHLALGNEEGELTFELPDENFVGNAVGKNITKGDDENSYKETVKMTTLDKFSKEQRIDRCDFIKIDIEGAEYFVFQGGINFIKKHRPVIQSEFNRPWLDNVGITFRDIAKLFNDIDYTCAIEKGNAFVPIENPLEYQMNETLTDLLFIPKETQSSFCKSE